mgnify:CR=1 FL=1
MKLKKIFLVICLLSFIVLLNATTIVTVKVKCSVCGRTSKHTAMMSSNRRGWPDLDLRPPEMLRSTMECWVQKCPNCGYANTSIKKLIKNAKKIVYSPKYKTLSQSKKYPSLANKFLCSALINYKTGNYKAAASLYLRAAWSCDDNKQVQNAITCRKMAIKLFFLAKKNGMVISKQKGVFEILIIDLFRRTKQFALARKYIKQGLDIKGIARIPKKCLKYQLKLVNKKDIRAHTIKEALN